MAVSVSGAVMRLVAEPTIHCEWLAQDGAGGFTWSADVRRRYVFPQYERAVEQAEALGGLKEHVHAYPYGDAVRARDERAQRVEEYQLLLERMHLA